MVMVFYLSPFESTSCITDERRIIMVKVGDKIRIIDMDGEPRYNGREGIVVYIDSIGQIHGTWGGCALIPGNDQFEIIERKQD